MPFVRVDGIIVNPKGGTKSQATVRAAREHHIRAIATKRADAGHHVSVVVSRAAGTVNSKEDLAGESAGIHRAAENEAAAHVDCSDLVKCWRDSRVLRVARADAPKTAARISAADEKIAIAGHIERSPLRRVGNADWSLPRCSVISRTTESSELASGEFGPKLVLKTVTHAGGRSVNCEPFLIAAMCPLVGGLFRPRLAAICRPPDIATKCVD